MRIFGKKSEVICKDKNQMIKELQDNKRKRQEPVEKINFN